MNLDECRSKAFELYKQTVSNPAFDGANYWQIGCIFDTLTDYLQQDASFSSSRKVSADQVKAFMAKTYDLYQSLVTHTPANYSWYDDFAWWGIACSKAFWPTFAGVFGDLTHRYQQISLATWETMKNGKCDHVHYGAPNAWDKCDQKLFAVCKPKIAGGVWQYDIFGDPRPLNLEDSFVNPSTPIALPARTVTYEFGKQGTVSQSIKLGPYDAVSLGPFQLTVVNGLYFVLANRLVEQGYEDPKTADDILGFFNGWFDVKDAPPLDQAVAGGRLIRERVSVYSNGTPVNEWHGDNFWAGDQGLLLGALADYQRRHAEAKWIDQWLKDIIGGVAGSMNGSKDNFHYLMPWFSKSDWFAETDPGDYSSGIGVYMRYLNYAYASNQTVKNIFKNSFDPMRQLVLNSAATVIAGKLPRWMADGIYPFDYFNQLAIMVMAISLLKPNN